ncbi:DUF58 domain-containing protein [Nocardioides flavescens]|uniref:DUF58 domain-containing protein n=1 Tax=Nocardioides flavescens TaxID=2691959 RepID=A0A6L7F2C7_9ACTN|nr:DUF58 domain-containing protein [Nocardioides flavescens]MXG90892.1 DUF58 domain-containing protein [Nocardioides flavescens]
MSTVLVARRRAVARVADVRGALADRTARARDLAAPVTGIVSPAAWVLAALAPVGLLGGVLLRWAELTTVATFVVPLLGLAALFVLGRYQLEADLDLTRDRVVVGERAVGRVVVRNVSRRRSLPGSIELPVGIARADFDIPSLATSGEVEDVFVIPTERRAVLDVGPVTAVRADPLGLFRREQHLSDPELLYVHPRTVRVEGTAAGLIRDLEGQPVPRVTDADISFHALRAYVPGDDRRHIHWKTSARTGSLMVRQFEETRRSHLLLALSTRIDEYADDEEFELAVSAGGSLSLQTFADRHELSVATSRETVRVTTPTRLMDEFAALGFEAAAPRLPEAVRRLARDVTGASVAILVCGSLVSTHEMRRARQHLPLDVRTIVLRCAGAEESSLRPLGDLTVATLASLEELGRLMRRAS